MKPFHLALVFTLILAAGCGRMKDKATQATNKAGQLVGEGAGSFFTGVGAGIDKTVTAYDIRLSEELRRAGVTTTVAKREGDPQSTSGQQKLSIYIQNRDALSGTLRILLFNEDAQEIGRGATDIAFQADDARYVTFPLEKEVPVSMAKYLEMDLKK